MSGTAATAATAATGVRTAADTATSTTSGSSATSTVGTRRMRWWDLDAVLRTEVPAFGPDAWSREAFLSELAGPGREYLLLQAPGTGEAGEPGAAADGTSAGAAEAGAAGYLGVVVNGPDAELQTVAVAPDRRGHGLGRLLLRRAVEVAREAGARRLHLEVREDNDAALALYASAGFRRTGRRPGYYAATSPGGPRTAALLMQVDLTGEQT